MTPFIRLHPADDVLIARSQLIGGTTVENIQVKGLIPPGHKVATRAIATGEPVRRYNQIIGFATQPIAAGEHVHTHNLGVGAEGGAFARDYAFGADVKPVPAKREATFMGIRRADGRVATRNYIGILSSVNCSATVCRKIAEYFMPERLAAFPNVDGVVAFTHNTGCGMSTPSLNFDVFRRTLAGYARHANLAAVLIIGLGCERNQVADLLSSQALAAGPKLVPLIMQDTAGTRASIQMGIDAIQFVVFQVLLQPWTSWTPCGHAATIGRKVLSELDLDHCHFMLLAILTLLQTLLWYAEARQAGREGDEDNRFTKALTAILDNLPSTMSPRK